MKALSKKNDSPFAVVPALVFKDGRLSKTDLRVLGALMTFMTPEKRECFPKRKTLAERCGLPLCKISTSTSRLVELGWLIKRGNGGNSRSVKYTFVIPSSIENMLDKNTDSVTVTETRTQTVTELVRGKEVTNEVKIENEITDARFNLFWEAYPRKCSKNEAIKAWYNLSPNQTLTDQIIAAVAISIKRNPQWQQESGRYIPYPAKYLANQLWEDELHTSESSIAHKPSTISRLGDPYVYRKPSWNRREHSALIGSAIDTFIENEF